MSSALLDALGVQKRVVLALVLRETKTRYGRLKAGYLWALIEPILFVAVLYMVFALLRQRATGDIPLVIFLITGIVPFLTFRHVMQQVTNAVDSNRALLTFPQVTIFDLVYARVLLETATMGLVFALLVFGSTYMGITIRIPDPLGVVIAFALLVAIGAGAGMIFCAIASYLPSFRTAISPFLGRPLFFISGVFFTADMLPQTAREYALYNPLLHAMEYLRSSFFTEFESPYYDLIYAGGFALALVALGFSLMHLLRDRLALPQ